MADRPITMHRHRASDALDAIAGIIRAERLRRGWTLDDLTAKSGVSRGTVCRAEGADQDVQIVSLGCILDALSIRISVFTPSSVPWDGDKPRRRQ